MTNEYPVRIDDGEWDRSLWWMVLISGALHLAAIVTILLMPQRFLHHPPPLVSYSVDLVAPDRVGGSNIVQGGKGRVEGPPLVSEPPVPKVEPPKPPPPPVEAKPEPPKAPEQVAKPAEPPKVEEKPKEDEVALAEKVKQPSAPPAPTAAKPEPSPKAVAKAEAPKVDAKAAAEAKKAAEAKVAADTKAAKEAAAAKARDERIAAAVRKVEQRSAVRGGGLGNKPADQPGGPVSVGPGEGVGGTIKGLEYLLYYNQLLNRIKQNWAWAGTNRSLEAVVRFNITESGEILNVRIAQASGDPSYDASVERAIRAVNPLQPPPEAYRKQFGDVELTFSPEQMQR